MKLKKFGGAVLEILAELVLTLVFFGLGILVTHLFGADAPIDTIESDLLVLIGIGACAAVFTAIFIIVKLIKRAKRG